MGKRIGIGGFQNSGKSFSRKWIPDGRNVMVLQPSVKSSYLFDGPAKSANMTPAELDDAIEKGSRKMLPDFDLISPEGKFKNINEAVSIYAQAKNRADVSIFDVFKNLNDKKPSGYFKPEHIKGNTILCPRFEDMNTALMFVNKHLLNVHTVILPDFTHFITEVLTSDDFRSKKYGNDAFGRYIDLAADALRSFIKNSDTLRPELVVVTEFHIEFMETQGHYELFTPGGKMLKDKFLPSSYYDMFVFTDVQFSDDTEEAEPSYQYITRRTKKYPEARSMGLYDTLYAENNIQELLTRFRKFHNISL